MCQNALRASQAVTCLKAVLQNLLHASRVVDCKSKAALATLCAVHACLQDCMSHSVTVKTSSATLQVKLRHSFQLTDVWPGFGDPVHQGGSARGWHRSTSHYGGRIYPAGLTLHSLASRHDGCKQQPLSSTKAHILTMHRTSKAGSSEVCLSDCSLSYGC